MMKIPLRPLTLRAASRIFPVAVAVLFLFATAFAQTDQGAVTGVVEDSSGAVIPNARVTVTNVDTGLALQVKSNQSGVFVVSPLKVGNYEVSATANGFQTVTRKNLHLDIQQRLNVTLALPPGSVSQTVTITSAAPLLQTQDAAVGQVISAKAINDTPLNGRNWVYIAQLTAGVAPPFWKYTRQRHWRFRCQRPARGAEQLHPGWCGQQH